MSWCDFDLTFDLAVVTLIYEIFNFGSVKMCPPAIFETCFSYNKVIGTAATDYCMHFCIIVLFPLTAIL